MGDNDVQPSSVGTHGQDTRETVAFPLVDTRRILELAPNDEYAAVVASHPFESYRTRVQRSFSFRDLPLVLDIGCGFGQWTRALSEVNDCVIGVDVNQQRLDVARQFCLECNNVRFVNVDALTLPFPDASVDGIWCYGVFMFLPKSQAIAEFRRVLKPGAPLYLGTNAKGWWAKLALESVRTGKRSLAKTAMRAYRSTQDPPHSSVLDEIFDGFVGMSAHDGALSNSPPLWPATYLGMDCVIEFLLRRVV